MGAGRQEGIGDNHARSCAAQAQRKAILVQLLGRAVPIVGEGLEAAITSAACVAADRQRERVDHPHGVIGLAAHDGQAPLDEFLDAPEAGRLPREPAAVAQVREVGPIMGVKVREDVLVRAALEVCATDLAGDHLLVGQGGGEATPSDVLMPGERLLVLADQPGHGDDKMVTIHGGLLSCVQVVRYPLVYEEEQVRFAGPRGMILHDTSPDRETGR